METMIPPQVRMRLQTKKKKKEKKRGHKKKRKGPNKKKKKKIMREKERRDNVTILFHYRTWLVYSNDGLPQNALGLREQASWMHNHLVYFVELSYIYSSSASVAWQSLLTHIDIY